MLKKELDVVDSPAFVIPISLMTVAYKLYTAIWAERFHKHVTHLVDIDQRGFMRGRLIFENIILVLEAKKLITGDEMILLLDLTEYRMNGWNTYCCEWGSQWGG